MELFIIITLCICAVTLAGVGYLVFRKTETVTKNEGIVIGVDAKQIENMRSQNSNEHSAHEHMLAEVLKRVRKMSKRLGFLDHDD